MRLTIMQPYFIPYAGYFRLFLASDLFVLYDCVQFPARSWVHRNHFQRETGHFQWLTLPLQKSNRTAKIKDILFKETAQDELRKRFKTISFLSKPESISRFAEKQLQELHTKIHSPSFFLVDYLHDILQHICSFLGITCPIIRSSTLALNPLLKGQDRILEICRHFGAQTYINSPNGRSLYDPLIFRKRGIDLEFLHAYTGSMTSILQRLLQEDKDYILNDLHRQTVCS